LVIWISWALLLSALVAGCTSSWPPLLVEASPAAEVTGDALAQPVAVPSFEQDIRPMYAGCGCHGYEEGRFDPSDYAGTRRVVVPGDAEASAIVQMMREGHHALPRLKADQLELLIAWIEAGAPDN
jgi:hypothetical protein